MRLSRRTRSPAATSLIVGTLSGFPVSVDPELLFIEAYRQLHGRLLDYAGRFLGRADAEDAVGDALEALWRQWPTLTPEMRNDKYVFGILRRCVRAKLEENKSLVSLDDAASELDRLAMRGAPGLPGLETAGDVLDAVLAAMTPRRREVFLLVREHSFTYVEAAEVLGLSQGTVNTHMRKAMKAVNDAFRRAGFPVAAAQPRRLPAPKGDDTND